MTRGAARRKRRLFGFCFRKLHTAAVFFGFSVSLVCLRLLADGFPAELLGAGGAVCAVLALWSAVCGASAGYMAARI